jgi:signal transduction histidine kinase
MFKHHRYPRFIILQAVYFKLRFTLSYRDVDLIDEILNLFEDQIRVKKISVRKDIMNEVKVKLNEMLVYVLISNILRNAIIHNKEVESFINIAIDNNRVSISNSGHT